MKNGVKVLLILTLMFSMVFNVFADTNTDAELLAELNLLTGTGSSYELDKALTRAEASTFIVKIVGEQESVLSNPKSLSVFSDVKGNEWFVPYVSYCYSNGIVSGYPDGTFQPNKIVSEQEFLSMMLKVIGETEISWDAIHAKAYSEGLITASSVDSDFLRGDVVTIMTNSLEMSISGTSDTVISRLVEKEVVSEDLAVAKGLIIKDEIKSDISSVKVVSNNEVKITMNEEIDSAAVVLLDGDNQLIDVTKTTISKKVITIKTETLENESYTMMIDEVVDGNGIITNGLKTSIVGLPKIIQSNFFRISTVEAVSKDLIHVTFTHPVTSNTALASNFTIELDNDVKVEGSFDTLATNVLGSDPYTIELWLKDYSLKDGEMYELIVDKDASSLYGSEMNNGKDDSFDFVGTEMKNDSFDIEDITVVKDGYIRVRFNQDIDSSTGTSNSKYTLRYTSTDTASNALDVVMTGLGEWKNREVTVKYVMSENKEYEFIIDNVKNAFREQKIEEAEYGFVGFPKDEGSEIEYSKAVTENYVIVYFTDPVDGSSIDDATILVGSRAPDEILFDSDSPSKIELFMSSSAKVDSDKSLYIDELYNIYAQNMGELTGTVDGSSKEFSDISIKTAKRISDDQVLIDFNYAVDTSTSKIKFDLEYTDKDGDKDSLDANSISFLDSYTAIVKFTDMDLSTDYKIIAKDIKDVTSTFTTDEIRRTVE